MKPKRHQDPELLEGIRTLPCAVCLGPPPNDAHHLKTVGSGGPDEDWNVIPLCREHHAAWHGLTRTSFFKRWPRVLITLEVLGWEWDGKKLTHPKGRAA